MTPSRSEGWRVRVCADQGVSAEDPNRSVIFIRVGLVYTSQFDYSVFLVDHAWTFLPDKCREQLFNVPGLAQRMANLMDLNVLPSTPPDSGNSQSLEPLPTQNGTNEGDEDEESESESEEETEREEEEEGTDNEEVVDSEEGNVPSEELVSQIMDVMWRFSDSYSITNVVS